MPLTILVYNVDNTLNCYNYTPLYLLSTTSLFEGLLGFTDQHLFKKLI